MNDFNDPATWDLIQKGLTIGCFQIKKPLGRQWCKKIAPESLEQLSAVIALVRPGCLEVVIDGKNVPQKYADRKRGEEEVTYKYSCLEPILQNTLGLMIYQEQAIRIGREVAGFSLEEADTLRRAIGKKDTEVMAKAKEMFLEGCKKAKVVTEEVAQDIFDMIEKSQRYSFNVAHSVSYAMLAYEMAYHKTHYPVEFFCGNLEFSDEKSKPLEEYRELVSDAKNFNIDVLIPDLRHLKESFYIRDDKIYYGLSNVKGVGSGGAKLCKLLEGKDLDNMTWYEFLRDYSAKINKTTIINLVSVGAFDFLGVSRNRLIYEYEKWDKLSGSAVSLKYLQDKPYKTLLEALKGIVEGEGYSNKNKLQDTLDLINILETPPYSLNDTPGWIAQKEKELLGISITFHSVDDCDTETANCTCKDFLNGYNNKNINIAVELSRVSEYTIPKGKNEGQIMAFISGSDSSAQLECITCFGAEYATFKELLVEGNTVIISGSRSKQNSLVVKVVTQI